MAASLAWLLVAIVLASLYLAMHHRVAAARRRRLPPGPTPLPLVGNLLSVSRSGPHRSLARLAERYCPLMRVRLGVVDYVVASSPAVAGDIHHHSHNAHLASRPLFDVWRGAEHHRNSVIVLPLHGVWRAQRRLATEEVMSPRRLDALAPTRREKGLRRRMGKLVARAYGIIDELLARRKGGREAGEPRKDDMLDVALDNEDEWKNNNPVIDRNNIKGLIADLFVAGTDSGSTAIEWAIVELLQNPQSMQKVKDEFRRVLGTRTEIEESDISQLPYLQAVLKETLRLHPSVPMTYYKAEATVEVQGYIIPKGTNIILNIWAIHRKPDVWADPDRFMPERFMETDTNFFGKHPEFIPFGGGRRICLGLPLAYRMVHMVLASLLFHFDWKLPEGAEKDGVDMREKYGMVLHKETPLKALAIETYNRK
uniref:Cytochrome P450 n=2 Tax=Oryza sativa subsp. japonica TaxID=39947 RepID=Q6K6E3_ORYSJ|nr:putative cytochrome P450 [Oryza sativa Japonica Group]